jgi:hypothetical protein
VLGLIPDDLYGELLRLVAERDPKAVFPLVDRLAEAGADFGEFVAGAAETLRAVLQVCLGGEPEGLTDGMFALVKQYSARLSAPDIVRLLTILGGMEVQVRQSGHPRLVVELLLLRWAMADRTVEIGEVIRALGETGGRGDVGTGGRGVPPEQLRDVVPAHIPSSPHPHVPDKGPLSATRLQSLWPSIVARARESSPMLATMLGDVQVVAAAGDTVTLAAAGHSEGLAHKKDAIGKLIGEWVTGPVKIVFGEPSADPTAPPRPSGSPLGPDRPDRPVRPDRLTAETANLERLKVLRAKDPTLGAAVDALDLELME